MVEKQVMKGVEEPLGTIEIGNVGTWVHLDLDGLASAKKVLCK
jgi:hypothetical protein